MTNKKLFNISIDMDDENIYKGKRRNLKELEDTFNMIKQKIK